MQDSKFFVYAQVYIKFMKVANTKKIYDVLSTLKNNKLKINNILIEKHKDMLENPDSEQNY